MKLGQALSSPAYSRHPAVILTALLFPAMYFGAHAAVDAGFMNSTYTQERHADGPLEPLFTALGTLRDDGACAGACGEASDAIDALDPSERAHLSACLTPDGALGVREHLGDQRRTITLVIDCGEGGVWDARLRNDVANEHLLVTEGDVPSNWSLVSVSRDRD